MKESSQLYQISEEFASEGLFYLNENETQTEIIDTLHQTCSKFSSLKLEVTLIRLPRHEDTCTLCHEVVNEIITNLEDPDMELKVIEILLKGCNNAENFVQKCKRLIIQYAPVILERIKKFLKERDFCNSIHVCGGKTFEAGALVLRSISTA